MKKKYADLIVRYELFVPRKNEDILGSFLADQFVILFDGKQLNNKIKNTSIEKNITRASGFVNFKSWNEETKIHGDHITSGGKVGNWRNCFTDNFVLLFKEKHRVGDESLSCFKSLLFCFAFRYVMYS